MKQRKQQQQQQAGKFPIPSSLQDLEREPYNLLPYPDDFREDADDDARAESFRSLVDLIDEGNRYLSCAVASEDDEGRGGDLEEEGDEDAGDGRSSEEDHEWMDRNRLQALYTLVR